MKKKKKTGKLSLIGKPDESTKVLTGDLTSLEEAFDGDKELVLFFLTWLKHNRNATKAYQELNPKVSYHVAGVLGCRLLKKVNIEVILEAYGIGHDTYFKKLKDGLEAAKINHVLVGKYKNGKPIFKKVVEPDLNIQDKYHNKLGELLGIQGATQTTTVAVQVNNLINDKKNSYGI